MSYVNSSLPFVCNVDPASSPHPGNQSKKLKLIEENDRVIAEKLQAEENSKGMDSSEEYEDSGNESSGEDVEFAMEREERGSSERNPDEEYTFQVLSTEQIVQHMVDCIRDVSVLYFFANSVIHFPLVSCRSI